MQEEALRKQQENLERMEQLALAKQEERMAQIEREARDKMAAKLEAKESSSNHSQQSSQQMMPSSASNSGVFSSGTASAEASRMRSSLLEDTAMLLQANPMVGNREKKMLNAIIRKPFFQVRQNSSCGGLQQIKKTPPRVNVEGCSDSNPGMVQPSPTVNTKEAFSLVRQMWGKETAEEPKGMFLF